MKQTNLWSLSHWCPTSYTVGRVFTKYCYLLFTIFFTLNCKYICSMIQNRYENFITDCNSMLYSRMLPRDTAGWTHKIVLEVRTLLLASLGRPGAPSLCLHILHDNVVPPRPRNKLHLVVFSVEVRVLHARVSGPHYVVERHTGLCNLDDVAWFELDGGEQTSEAAS